MTPRFGTLRAACVLGLTGLLGAGSAAVAQEGTAQLGTTQALRASTVLRVVVLDASVETIVWSGLGSVAVSDPAGLSLGTFSSGQVITPTTVGVYLLEPDTSQQVGTPWNVTVQNPVASGGRLHSLDWQFDAGSFAASAGTDASFYALVPGGTQGTDGVIELQLAGLAGYVYDINANPFGVDGAAGGRSVPAAGNTVTPQYPIYLQVPSVAAFGAGAPTVGGLGFEGATVAADVFGAPLSCGDVAPGVSAGTFTFTSSLGGSSHLQCDLDGDGEFATVGGADLLLIGPAVAGANTVTWDGSDANGQPVAAGSYLCRVRVTVGEFHYVGRDIETSYPGMRLYEVEANGARTPLVMYWDDADVQASAVSMANGVVGLATSGPAGLLPGPYGTTAVANVDARSWGNNTSGGKGNEAYLDTYTWLQAGASALVQVGVVDGGVDTDGDGLADVVENCTYGTDPGDPDTDGDGTNDGLQYAPSGSSSAQAGGLESHGGLAVQLAARRVRQTRVPAEAARPLVVPRDVEELASFVPPVAPDGSVGEDLSPRDLPALTNAEAVLGVDYRSADGDRVASVLLVETRGEAYEHDKALCDRAEGRILVGVGVAELAAGPVVALETMSRSGGVRDKALSFRLDATDVGWDLNAGWLAEDLPSVAPDQRVVTVQIWSADQELRDALGDALLERVAEAGEITAPGETPRVPRRWLSRAATLGGRTLLSVVGPGATSRTSVRALVRSGAAEPMVEHPVALPPEGGMTEVAMPPYREATLELLVEGRVVDRAWISDGVWAPYSDAVWGAGASELSFDESSCEDLTPLPWSPDEAGSLTLAGCASAAGTVDQVGGVARWLGGGLAPLDASVFGSVSLELDVEVPVVLCLEGAEEPVCAEVHEGVGTRTLVPGDFDRDGAPVVAFPSGVQLVSVARRHPGPLRLSVSGLTFGPAPAVRVPDEGAGCTLARRPSTAAGWALLLVVGAARLRRRSQGRG